MVKLQNSLGGLSALHGFASSDKAAPLTSKGKITITDTGLMDKVNLRCNPDNAAIAKALFYELGLEFPKAHNSFYRAGHRFVVWLAPDEWLLLGEIGMAGEAHVALNDDENALDGGHVSVVNVSDAFGGVIISGDHCRDLLAKFCALDLHSDIFTQGTSAQTLLSHAGVILICLGETEFMIIGRSSFMPYIAKLLTTGAGEYGYDLTIA